MRVDEDKHTVELTRRNLTSLLAKLDGNPPWSACTIYREGWFVRAVEDGEHYRDRRPGEMHPDTEARLARRHEAVG